MKTLTNYIKEALINKKVNIKNDYVDLGLPSGILWCSHNLGAETETDFGLYYQWGGVKGYKDAKQYKFDVKNTPYYKDGEYVKYNKEDRKIELDNEDDSVWVETHGEAKLPTKDQIQELIVNTEYEWTKIDGVVGGKFTAENGNYIFFPAAGYCDGSSVYNVGSYVIVWSRSLNPDGPYRAWGLDCRSSRAGLNGYGRYNGFSVRGVIN